jgi:Protein of unknown function (DUF2505)
VRIQDEIHYAASPSDVAAMLADPDFSEQVSSRMGASSARVEVDGQYQDAFTVTTVRTLPTDGFPDIARKLVGETVDVRQIDAWKAPDRDGARTGTITVEIVGAPLRLNGTLRLAAGAQGTGGTSTVETIDGELRASVPLIGGKLEKAAEPAIRGAIRQQTKVGKAWFA